MPGVRLLSWRVVTLVSCCLSVFTAARSAAEGYSITDLVYAKLAALPVPVTSKPRLLRPEAAWPARPATPEPFRILTLTLDGLVVSTWAPPDDGVADGATLTFGTVTSCAMAENTSPACGCANWTRAVGSCGQAWLGAVMNWTFLLDTLRRLSAMPTRSDTVMPLSVVIEAAASVTTESSRSGSDSSPLSSTPLTTCADMN